VTVKINKLSPGVKRVLINDPKNFDYHVKTQDAKKWAPLIIEEIKK